MDTARGRRSASGHDRCSAGSERRDPLIKSQHKIADFAQNFFKPAAKCAVTNQSVASNLPTADAAHMTDKPAVKIEINAAPKHNGKHLVAATVTNGMIDC
jgi:hypothetical protein